MMLKEVVGTLEGFSLQKQTGLGKNKEMLFLIGSI